MKLKSKIKWMAALVMGMAMTCVTMMSCSVEDNPVESDEFIENEDSKEELVIGSDDGMPMVGAQSGYIYAAKLLGCKDKKAIQNLISEYQNKGWQIIDKDLNAKAGGKYIYLAVKTCNLNSVDQGTAITNFLLMNEYHTDLYKDGKHYFVVPYVGDSGNSTGPNYISINSNFDGDLNAGAGGKYIYLYYTRDNFDDQRAVTKVVFNNESSDALGLEESGDGYDLNTKTKKKGEKIYMHMETANVARFISRSRSNTQCKLDGIIGDTKNIKAVSIPLTFDNLNVKEATINELKDGSFPDLEIQNYFVGSKVTYAIVLTKNTGFKQVNILDKTGNIYMSDALPDNIEEIAPSCFKGMSIEKIYLPLSLIKIRSKAFMDCQSLKEIYYGHNILRQEEIKKLWEEVEKGDDWNKNVHPDFNVIFISSEGS